MQWKNGRPKRKLECTMLRTSPRLCHKTTHFLHFLVTRRMGIVRVLVLVRAKVCVVARTKVVRRPLMVAVTMDLDQGVRRITFKITHRLRLPSTAGQINKLTQTELRRPLLRIKGSRFRDTHHLMGRGMLDAGTNSCRNRSGNMIHNQHRAIIILATSHQCAVMMLIRHMNLGRCPGRDHLHKSSRSILTKHKLENLLAAPQKWQLCL